MAPFKVFGIDVLFQGLSFIFKGYLLILISNPCVLCFVLIVLIFQLILFINYSFNFRIPDFSIYPDIWYFRIYIFYRYILPLISSDRRFQQLSRINRYIYQLCKLTSEIAWKTEALFCVLSDFIFSVDILYLQSILIKIA